ncbi:MAG TPA: hypothetical protein VK249_26175, partial [Anaerolineales bacterium]|nr:hypothetical protein [Anaerolineales bacterium]
GYKDFLAVCRGEIYVDKYLAEMARLDYRNTELASQSRDFYSFRVVAAILEDERNAEHNASKASAG